MDCYSVESEFIDSLDFLSPPVKRLHNSREPFGSVYHNGPNNVHLLRGLRNKFARRTPSPTKVIVKKNAESSTSLVLKRTSERQILEHYSIVSYTSLHPEDDAHSQRKSDKTPLTDEKPLIKVTVIPKTDQIQTAKILRKRRYIPKRVHSTTSNHENSVQTKNVYLIVAGRRREKIYEIKTTGSAKFSTDQDSFTKDDEIPIKELSNFQHLIQSLNMDRKKKKGKRTSELNTDAQQQPSVAKFRYPSCKDCLGTNVSKDESETHDKKSHIRIYGQFGISEDDKYVLRYGATVNDTQVLSDVAQLTRDFSPVLIPMNTYGTPCHEDPELQKDSCIQANGDDVVKIEKVAEKAHSKESQGTQVNFNVQVASMKEHCSKYSDKKIQCTCCAVANKSDHKGLKDCQSPLVIISVYPKTSPGDISPNSVQSPTEIIGCPSPQKMSTLTSNQILKIDQGTKKSNSKTKKDHRNVSISRSQSPKKHASKIKVHEDKLIETRIVNTQLIEKKSPDRQNALKAIKEKIQEKHKLNHDVATRQTSIFNTSNATQVSQNLQNATKSNATQVSNKHKQRFTSSHGTQVSNRNQQNYTVSTATQYSKSPRSFLPASIKRSISPPHLSSNATQISNSPHNIISPNKQSNVITPIKYPQNRVGLTKPSQNSYASNTISQNPQNYVANNGTQVYKNENFTATSATQVSKKQPKTIITRVSKNQATLTVPNIHSPTQVFKNERNFKPFLKSQEKGTNTEHAKAKKVLVETYTKKLTEQMIQKDVAAARDDSSKVTINIDGDKEYYNVLFNQDKFTTDLKIRKTVKDMSSQRGQNYECSASLENLYLPDCTETMKAVLPENKSPTQSMSNAMYNNRSDEEPPIAKHVSRVTIRDSLEISHRREDKTNFNNIKNTQTCFTAQFSENIPDETEFLAPIKHFTGDDCSIGDPIERDKQIRELLGVNKNRFTYSKSRQALNYENADRFPYQCIYSKKSQVTEINFQFQKLCPCFKPRRKGKSVKNASVSVQCRHTHCGRAHHNHKQHSYNEVEEGHNGDPNAHFNTREKCCVSSLRHDNNNKNLGKKDQGGRGKSQDINRINIESNDITHIKDKKDNDNNDQDDINEINDNNNHDENTLNGFNGTDEMTTDDKKYDGNGKSAIYQQLVLNRNIQVFLQVEQFSKQKPIVLSRKQYNKVKKTIQKTINNKNSHDKKTKQISNKGDMSEVSVGEVRIKVAKDTKSFVEKEAQTNKTPCNKEYCRRDKNKRVWDDTKRKSNSSSKHYSTDQSNYSSDIELDKHGGRKLERLPTSCVEEDCFKPNNEQKVLSLKRSPELHKIKPKIDQNVEVLRTDLFSKASWCSECGEYPTRQPNVERIGQTMAERNVNDRVGERNREHFNKRYAECNVGRNSERKGALGYEIHSGQKVERGSDRYNETKVDRFVRRCSEQKEESSRDRLSDQNEEQDPEQKSDEKKDKLVQQNETEVKTLVLFNADATKGSPRPTKESVKDAPTRKVMSSVEIRYASVAYMKQVAYSSTDVGALSDSSIAHVNSFHTIFRGHRKSPTPNLGTSAYSLYSEDGYNTDNNKSAKFIMEPRGLKPKKPFLRRLMSCLVMRSTRESELKLPTAPAPDIPSVNSSIDSYHISTSLGAVEVSSSIYDTSASFYSNHTILPINSKIKRGFFSSVRGFLTNRKS